MKSTPSPQQIEQLAHRQLLDYKCNNPGTCFSEPGFNMTVAAAYHLQDAVTGLRVRAGENVIRILPPLTVNKKEIDQAIKIIKKVCKDYNL